MERVKENLTHRKESILKMNKNRIYLDINKWAEIIYLIKLDTYRDINTHANSEHLMNINSPPTD